MFSHLLVQILQVVIFSLELLDGSIVLVSVVLDQVAPVGGVVATVEEGTGEEITAGEGETILIDFQNVPILTPGSFVNRKPSCRCCCRSGP